MKKKIVNIFVCMLLIFSTATPVIGIRNDKITNPLSIKVDKKQGENLPSLLNNVDYEIIRDDYGVPHVYADTKEGLAFGMGYAQAEDRLWQIDVLLREVTGRLAEYGLATVKDDHFIRRLGYSKEEVKRLYNNFTSQHKGLYEAYISGINKYIDEAFADPDNKMPAEYIDRDLLPEYLTVEDVLQGFLFLLKRAELGTGQELFYLIKLFNLIVKNGRKNGWKIFNDLYPLNDPGAATTLYSNISDNSQNIPENPPFYPPMVLILAQQIIKNIKSNNHISEILGVRHHIGSNAWVISSEKSASGNPLLLAGPQSGHSVPHVLFEVGLHGAEIDLVGTTRPGLGPVISDVVGKWCAWAWTSGFSDTVDIYIERLHPFNKLKYKFNGGWLNMENRTEIIYDSKGKAHTYELYRTIHGSVIGKFWIPILGGFAITRTESDFSLFNRTVAALLSLPECKNVSEFRTQIKDILFSANYLVADRYGNIGYFHSGWYPIRPEKGLLGRNIDPRLPLWGTGKEEWQGILPFEEHPQGINPPEGFYANWNNRPSPDWPYSEGYSGWQQGGWGENVRRIQELLEADDSISFEDMLNICKNVAYHEHFGTNYKPFLMEAINNIGGIPADVVTALENWDCYYHDVDSDGFYDDPGITIFKEWYIDLYNKIFGDEIPNKLSGDVWGLYLHVLQGDDSPLELRYKDYLNGVPRDEMIINALQDALITLENQYGTSNVSEWLYPVFPLTWNTPIFDEIGNLKSPEKLGYDLPWMNRGCYNHIAEMPNLEGSNASDPPIGVNILSCGQSGFVKYPDIPSPHAYDQLELYLDWQFKPMLYNLSLG